MKGKFILQTSSLLDVKHICISMAYNMSELQKHYINDEDIMFLSHSVTPIIDSVSILKDYAIKKGVIDGKWKYNNRFKSTYL